MLADLIKRLGKKSDAGDQRVSDGENKSQDQVTESKDQAAPGPAEAVKAATAAAIAKAMEARRAAVSRNDPSDTAEKTDDPKGEPSDSPEASREDDLEKKDPEKNKEKELQVAEAQESVRTFIERKFSAASGRPAASVAALRREIEEKEADDRSDKTAAKTEAESDSSVPIISADLSSDKKDADSSIESVYDEPKENIDVSSFETEQNGDDGSGETDDTKAPELHESGALEKSDESVDGSSVFNLNFGIGGARQVEFSEKAEKSEVQKKKREDTEKRNVKQVVADSFVSDSASVPLLVAVVLALIIIASLIDVSSLENRDNIFLSLIVIEVIVYLIPGIFYCKLKNIDYFSTLSLRPIGPDKIYFTILCSVAIIAVSVLGKSVLMSLGLYESEFASYASHIKWARSTTVTETIYIVVTFAIIPALCRSFLFGGIALGTYRTRYGYVASCITTAFLYAILHLNLTQFPIRFVTGILLSFGVLMTRSVLFFVIVAMADGLFALFFDEYVLGLMNSDYKVLFIFIIVAVILAFLTLIFSEGERISYNRGIKGEAVKEQTDKSFKESITEMFLSPTLLLCVIIFSVYAVTSKIFG